MKKYVIAYFILFLILLGMGLTHGIPFGKGGKWCDEETFGQG